MEFELKDEGSDLLSEIQDKLLGSLSSTDKRKSKIDVMDMAAKSSKDIHAADIEILRLEDIKYKDLATMLLEDLIPRLVDLDALPESSVGTMKAVSLTRIYLVIEKYHENFLKTDREWTAGDTMALILVTMNSRQN